MSTKREKKERIRNEIIAASHEYKNKLAGKVFLYIYGDAFFEVNFPVESFLHLTGVDTMLSAKNFYSKAQKGQLSERQFFFDKQHSYAVAKKKLPCLKRLSVLTNSLVCVVTDYKTITLTYRIGLTNLDFTLGLTENTDTAGNKINEWLLPRTLRVKDKSIENSSNAAFVDFILCKNASERLYSEVKYAESGKTIPDSVKERLASGLSF